LDIFLLEFTVSPAGPRIPITFTFTFTFNLKIIFLVIIAGWSAGHGEAG
jgi:hypothetical protein